MTHRGDIVIVDFPYVTGTQAKKRPALVIQRDDDNRTLDNTIIAMISGNIKFATTVPTQVLIDPTTAEGKSSNLKYSSVVKCNNLYTIPQRNILRTMGKLSATLIQKVNEALRLSQDLN